MEEKSFKDMAALVQDLLGIDQNRKAHLKEATQLVRGYGNTEPETGAVNTPIYQTATFAHPSYGTSTGFGYGRYGNPTRLELENTLAMLEHGKKAWAFSSGMAAISTAIASLSAVSVSSKVNTVARYSSIRRRSILRSAV